MQRSFWVLALCFVACVGNTSPSATPTGCSRTEGGLFTNTPCPSGYVCTDLVTNNACVARCQSDADCPTTQCCQRLTDGNGFARSYGGCIAPFSGDRSVCGGPNARADAGPPTSAEFLGAYVGSFVLTRTSDRPPMEGVVSREPAYGVVVMRAGFTGLLVTLDPACTYEAAGSGTAATLIGNVQGCIAQELLRGATLTLTSGTATIAGAQLFVRASFRYSLGGDTGTLDWEYTGTRR